MLKINIEEVLRFLKENRNIYKKIVLQAPDGLRNQLLKLYEAILNAGINVEVYISGSRNFGACDIAYEEGVRANADIIIHFGHTQFPYSEEQINKLPQIPVKYFPVYDDRKVSERLLHKLYSEIGEYRNIGLLYSVQYYPQFKVIRKKLEEKGFNIFIGEGSSVGLGRGQVIGCKIGAAKTIQDKVEAYVVISGGKFHALGVSLWTGVHTVLVDIPSSRIFNLDRETARIRSIIAYKLLEAEKINRFGIIVSKKSFQYNLSIARFCEKELWKRGKKGYILILDELNPQVLMNFPDLEGYIQTACPRISIDDIMLYKKPILNIEQFMILIGHKKFEEVYPWRERKAIQEKK